MKTKVIYMNHMDFLNEVLPYYEYLDLPFVIVGDPFGIHQWLSFENKIIKTKKTVLKFTYPYFLDEAIYWEEIPIGYRYNENIVFLLYHPGAWKKVPKTYKREVYKVLNSKDNTPIPDYASDLEETIKNHYNMFKPSLDLVGTLKHQYMKSSLNSLKPTMGSQRRSADTAFLDEIAIVEKSLSFHKNPTEVLREPFYQSAYREFKKMWIDQSLRLYIWYQGYIRQKHFFPVSIHDLLIIFDFTEQGANRNRIIPLTSYRVSSNGYYHPHINTGGDPCTGRNFTELDRFHRMKDIQGMIDVTIQYLNRYTGSGAYRKIDWWLCGCGRMHKSGVTRQGVCSVCGHFTCEYCSPRYADHTFCSIREKEREKKTQKTKKKARSGILFDDITNINFRPDSNASTHRYAQVRPIITQDSNTGTGD